MMRLDRTGWFVTFAFLAASFAAMPVAAQTRATASIAGTVAARAGGQPASGAVVTVDGTSLSTMAGGTGRFRIDNVPPGSVVLLVKAPGFLDLRSTAVP